MTAENTRGNQSPPAGSPFASLHDSYLDRTAAARAWVSNGGRVIGYTCETTPIELITAAGFLPYRLSGDPAVLQEAQARFVYPILPKGTIWSHGNIRSPQSVISMCSMVLEGRYDFLHRLVISNTRKPILMMLARLRDAKRAFPELPVPQTYVLDRTQTPFMASTAFNRTRVMAFREALAAWAGRPITDKAVVSAIAEQNQVRTLLRRVKALRSAQMPKLSGVEALWVYAASRTLPVRDFVLLTTHALNAAEARAGRSGKRIFVGGSSLDHSQFYELIEEDGSTVVGDDHNWGDRLAEHDVSTGRLPLAALVDHYESMAPMLYPLSASVNRTLTAARAARPDGAIFHVQKGDDLKLWEAPDERKALEGAQISSLHLKDQPYRMEDPQTVREEIRTFVTRLKESRA